MAPETNPDNHTQSPHDKITKKRRSKPRPAASEEVARALKILAEPCERQAPPEPNDPVWGKSCSRVYFIGAAGLVKVGVGRDVQARFGAHCAASPVPLTMLGVIYGDARLESAIHRLLESEHSHGEWFHSGPRTLALLTVIREIGDIDERTEAIRRALPPNWERHRRTSIAKRGMRRSLSPRPIPVNGRVAANVPQNDLNGATSKLEIALSAGHPATATSLNTTPPPPGTAGGRR